VFARAGHEAGNIVASTQKGTNLILWSIMIPPPQIMPGRHAQKQAFAGFRWYLEWSLLG